VAVRVALGMRRRAYHRREQLIEVAVEVGGSAQPFEAAAHSRVASAADGGARELPRVRREVFMLYELEDVTIAQAAEALGIPENTALYRLHAARDAVAAFVRKQELSSEVARVMRRGRVEVA
jgi:RNA polymerase sigma-70 factor (ECF subfamily)